MSTLTIEASMRLSRGGTRFAVGELPGGVGPRSISAILETDPVYINVPGATDVTYQTIWSSSTSLVDVFHAVIIVADPEYGRATDQQVDLRITNNAVTSIWRFGRDVPFMLGQSAQTTGAVTLIEVANLASTTVITDDVEIALCVYDK